MLPEQLQVWRSVCCSFRFFNFYWYFVSYEGLAEDCAKAMGSKESSRGLGITLGILSIAGWSVFALIPLVLIPLGIVYFIVWLLYSLNMVASANALAGRESQQASNSAGKVNDPIA